MPTNFSEQKLSHITFTENADFVGKQQFSVREKTVATVISKLLIDEIKSKPVKCSIDGTTNPEFIDTFIKNYAKQLLNDFSLEKEFLKVHILQMLILLKNSAIIIPKRCTYQVQEFSYETLNSTLFDTFWNKTLWASFFPSMPTVAEHLHTHRNTAKELILNKQNSSYIDSIAIDYMLQTNYEYRNELLYISFFDFSVVRWLSFFGKVSYLQSENSRISISR